MKKASGYRSSVTGLFISKETADANPKETYLDTFDMPIEIKSQRVKESLSYLLDTLQDKATEEEINDIEQLKLLI